MSRISRGILLLIPALCLPFLLTTVFVVAKHGPVLPTALWQWICVGAVTCSGLPFVSIMPIHRTMRVVIGVAFLPVVFVTITLWGVWLGCRWFGGCP
jgi:hypothetical protein